MIDITADVPDDTKRQAFHLCLAIERMIYEHPGRSVKASFVALAAAFQNLVEFAELDTDALTLFHRFLHTVTDPSFALPEDDPATRGYVFPAHESMQ